MTVYGENCRKDGTYLFLHTPKTAGKWLASVIRKRWGSLAFSDKFHHYVGVNELQIPGPHPHHGADFIFSFVRNPVDLYRSLWSYGGLGGWHLANVEMEFEHWVFDNQRINPSWCSKVFRLFTQENDFTGTYENLYDDLERVSRMLGFDLTQKTMSELSPVNVSKKAHPEVSDRVRELIEEKEKVAFSIWENARQHL